MENKFVCLNEVKSVKATLEEYLNSIGVESEKAENKFEQGYIVEYDDNVKVWMPEYAFNAMFKPCDTFLDRLQIEFDELYDRQIKCNNFINSDRFESILNDKYSALLLRMQNVVMNIYLSILKQRISIAEGIGVNCGLTGLSFGEAVIAMKFGFTARRAGWNGKGMFTFIRPSDTIPSEVVVGIVKSIPASVKDWISKNLDDKDSIKFNEYLCLKDAHGDIVNGWVASQTDILANDWEIIIP